ncbi:MAG: tetratricopeptide (TPR) repeat protein [Bacteroidia bacterium]|jgi:tetratricopeptide (TPR) repeat protein
MDIRQEQIVLISAVAIIAGLIATHDHGSALKMPRAKKIDLMEHTVPDAGRVLPGAPEAGFTRDILSEPTNARPMPLLGFQAPPILGLPSLAAPPYPGPGPASYGEYLRRTDTVEPLVGLFDAAVIAATTQQLGATGDVGQDTLSALREMGFVPDEEELLEQAPDRAALTATYKMLYDWILLDDFDYHFGSVENRDRYRLASREGEAVTLREVNPATGMPRMVAMDAVDYERARVTSFGFANSVTNTIELGAIERGGELTRGNSAERLSFADWCVTQRHESPRALPVAQDLYERLAAFDEDEPAPRLGLASCLEAGFEFEAAFAQYGVLIERFPKSAAVAAAMASLEERFLMLDEAEARLRDAVRFDRGSFQGQWALGSFLLRNGGDTTEAIQALALADRFAPDTTEAAGLRSDVRVDLGAAHMVAGGLKDAERAYRNALSANPDNQKAQAGVLTCAHLTGDLGTAALTGFVDDQVALGPDFLLARGLSNMELANYLGARDDLLAAAKYAPLTSHLPLRALSRLAELTSNDEEAMDYIEQALEVSPGDAWSQFQLGRLLLARDDVDGAEAALNGALAADVSFVDALVLLGDIAMSGGDFDSAERYFDRALRLEEPRVEVQIRRGLNALYRGDIYGARSRFGSAQAIAEDHPVAIAGLAWCEYLDGEGDEALNRLAGLDDGRRLYGEEDPWRIWAQSQKERIEEHLAKGRWVDDFARNDLRSVWLVEEGAGPLVELEDEELHISGQFQGNGEVRVFKSFPAVQFVSFAADFTISADSAARAGLFIAREQQRGGKRTVSAQVRVHRHKDGSLQTHVLRNGRPDEGAQDVTWMDFPAGETVRLRIERSGSDTKATVNIFVAGVPVLEDVPMSSIGKSTAALSVGFFSEGESGRRIDMTVDNVEIVRRGQ